MSVESNKRRRLLREAVRRDAIFVKNALEYTERAVRHRMKDLDAPAVVVELAVVDAQALLIVPNPRYRVEHFKRTGRW